MTMPHFTSEEIERLYAQMAKAAFSSALRAMIEQKTLSENQRKIASLVMSKSPHAARFFTKSHLIYLSNGISDAATTEQGKNVQNQLFLELGMRLISCDLCEKVDFDRTAEDTFIVEFNQHVPSFLSVRKEGEQFVLTIEKGEALLEKNRECSITQDINFLDEDKNPYNVNNDHPDAPKFVSYDLGGIEKERWVAQFRNAYLLIKEKVPQIYGEIYPFLDAIVPHGYQPNKQSSSSYSKSPGILYLSYVDDDVTQAEAIIHEVHHTIFNVIAWKHKLYENDDSELKYYSAYRPDARHFRGCFLGLHAFAAVQNFYRVLAETEHDKKYVEKFLFFYLKNRNVIHVLEKYGKFTPEGRMLFGDVCANFRKDDGFFLECQTGHASLLKGMEDKVAAHLEGAKKNNAVLLH